MIVPRLRLRWQDGNGKAARQGFHLPGGESVAASIARANALRDAAIPASNARLLGADLEYEDVIEPTEENTNLSDVRANLVLFFKDASGVRCSVRIPSPRLDLPYDVNGPWRAIRIERVALAATGLLDPLEAALSQAATPWGDSFPATFIVAGLDIVRP